MSEQPLQRPVVLYDGHCGFCKRHVVRWKAIGGDAIEYAPYQESTSRFPNISVDELSRAVHLVETDARVTSGAEAVFRIAALSRNRRGMLSCYEHVPPFRWVSDTGYEWIARHRNWVDPIDRLLFGSSPEPTSHRLAISVFLRALGVIYLIAFVSLWVQIHGLIGSHGILPIADAMRGAPPGMEKWIGNPTLLWLNQSDGFLSFICAGGVVMSVLLIAGVLPLLMLVGLWIFYLSLTVAGQDFLSFQWDALLLETGFAAMFVAPMQIIMRTRTMREPSHIGIWLLRWLAFRIMFLSGVTKLVAGDACWTDGTALTFHYWTQPLPPWTAWYINCAPLWFGKFSVCVMFIAELVIPFLIFTPRMLRRIAFYGIVFFQFTILLTGNYGFFNILTMALCIPLLDDSFFPKRLRRAPERYRWQPLWLTCCVVPVALMLVLLTSVAFSGECNWETSWPVWIEKLYATAAPFRSANGYGLFRVMTKHRYEIVVEGSDNGVDWKAYEFKYKPGDVDRRPAFLTPHMPRLDWQMWFAALSDRPPHWFVAFLQRLLEGSPQVTGLLETNPFLDHPPRYVRAELYDYHFADGADGRAWWQRKRIGEYVPIIWLPRK